MASIYRRPLPPLSLSLLEIFLLSADDALIEYLLTFWGPDDVARMHRVSQNVLIAIKNYVSKTWNIVSFFEDWFSHEVVGSVASTMKKCGALAVGSAVVQFLARLSAYPDSDLDILVPWWGLLEFGRFMRRAGYRYRPRTRSGHVLFDVAALTLPDRLARRQSNRGSGNVFAFGSHKLW